MAERLDLDALYAPIRAREEVAGAPAIDPRILLALWVYATSEGEGSAREIWRLTGLHDAYRWLCGGVAVGYHTLSDFRSQQAGVIDDLISQVLALLMSQDLVHLSRITQDGTRVRASAGAGSFRRERTLEALMSEARAHLETVMREAADPALSARRAAARRRGVTERLARLEAALAQVPEVVATKRRSGAKDPTPRTGDRRDPHVPPRRGGQFLLRLSGDRRRRRVRLPPPAGPRPGPGRRPQRLRLHRAGPRGVWPDRGRVTRSTIETRLTSLNGSPSGGPGRQRGVLGEETKGRGLEEVAS